MAQTDRRFAFGQNNADGCPCPILASGENPEQPVYLRVAEKYDYKVSEATGIAWGAVPEKVAKEHWLEMLDSINRELHPEEREIAREVAAELGWLGE